MESGHHPLHAADYTGRLVYGQSRVQARPRPGEPRRVRPEEPLVSLPVTMYAPDGTPLALPPVSPADFDEADRRMRARAHRKTSDRVRVSEHLLTGILRCAACDMAMYGRKRQVSAHLRHLLAGLLRLRAGPDLRRLQQRLHPPG